MEYKNKINESIIKSIAKITGIKESVLKDVAEKNGVTFILEHPNAIKCTKAQKEKLIALKGLFAEYSEAVFLKETIVLDSSTKSGEYFINRLSIEKSIEKFEVTMLNAQNEIISTITLFTGTVNESPIYPREIVKAAINHDSNCVLIAHNHPGGSLTPSRSDIDATAKIKQALESVGIKLLDHIIVANQSYTSFAEKGLL